MLISAKCLKMIIATYIHQQEALVDFNYYRIANILPFIQKKQNRILKV